VLVVDDEIDSALGTIRELKARHFEVDQACSQSEACARLADCQCDALLLDLGLPKKNPDESLEDPPRPENGLELFKSLLEGAFEPKGTRRDIPVFIVTAHGFGLEFLRRVRELRPRQIFTKPESPILMAETIRLTFEGK